MSDHQIHRTRPVLHYAWIVAFVGGVAVFCGLGLGRFAFGMLLPAMSDSLGWSYAQAGMLGFINLLGYLTSVLIVPPFLARVGTRVAVTSGLLLMALSMFAMVLAQSLPMLSGLYFLTGIGSGAVVLPALSVMANWFAPSHRGLATGLVMAGPGFGIIFSGKAVPNLTPFQNILAWQMGWLIFGAMSVVVAALAFGFLRNHPGQMGHSPFGRSPLPGQPQSVAPEGAARRRLLLHMGIIYGLYGATYMLYVTFIVTSMRDSYGMTQAQAGGLWSWFGILSIPSGLLFGGLSDRIGRRAGMAIGFACLSVAFACVGFTAWRPGLYVSVGLFGLAAWSIPVIISAAAGDYFGPVGTAKALAALMLTFSAGQAAGPALAGVMAEQSGDFSSSYRLATAAACAAVALVAVLRPPMVRGN
ncbi:YbfB/YjiJ family MFS transporter [Citreicella sp. C3M06]|uniref:MFS transporter n=1 Tax=Citreicella sp. C3M06 TaxID=2841564 RepID=UPI001C094A23|nr:MFS transporter [Citreicella sp. C3M06]MBU2963106.1 YbfB/YjiJ family MFS transporter [Citreicella sp. C3M06]